LFPGSETIETDRSEHSILREARRITHLGDAKLTTSLDLQDKMDNVASEHRF
jgi:hypothetical protein